MAEAPQEAYLQAEINLEERKNLCTFAVKINKTMADDKMLRMEELVKELNEASDAYYNGRGERMTDYCQTHRLRRFPRTPSLDRRKNMSLPPSLSPRQNNLPNW